MRARGRTALWALSALLLIAAATLLWRPDLLLPLPSRAEILEQTLAPSSWILDRNGLLLYEIVDPQTGVHRPLEIEQIPLRLRQAVIATEDASFYRNPGINLRAIARAAWMNLQSGRIVSGGSTITQQLARNLLMSRAQAAERSWGRKAHEALLAYHLTRTLTKDEILALYLNETYFGGLAYGVEAAARAFFDKPAAQLDLAESALLAGLPQAPSAYDPLRHLDAAKARQLVVLGLLVDNDLITAQEAALAYREPLALASGAFPIEAPHACMDARAEAAAILGEGRLQRGGLRIYTTIDLHVQRQAEAQVRRHLEALNRPEDGAPGHNVRNAAVVVLSPADGDLLAMVGSPDFFSAQIDGSVNAAVALRQPGSALKPLTYAAAFEAGYAPATVLYDVPRVYQTKEGRPYAPANYDGAWHGPVSLRRALACSYNLVAVDLLDRIGIDVLPEMAQRLGIASLSDADRLGLALTLGSGEVRLIDLTAAYGAFARGGLAVEPHLLERIDDLDGETLWEHAPAPPRRLLDERIAYLLSDVLADDAARAPAFGANSVLDLPFPAAVKTGTTTDWRDNWTVGYTPRLAVGVWVGNADNQPMQRISGVDGAAPIWRQVMTAAEAHLGQGSSAPFVRPAGLVDLVVCAESGALPGPACQHRVSALFLPSRTPQRICGWHQLVAIDRASGLPAGPDCPDEQRALRRVTLWPAEVAAWADEAGVMTPLDRWAQRQPSSDGAQPRVDLLGSAANNGPVVMETRPRITSPGPNSIFSLSERLPRQMQQIQVSATAPGAEPEAEMRLLVDGAPLALWSGPPYTVFWPLSPGVHELVVECGQARSQPVRILVHGGAGT